MKFACYTLGCKVNQYETQAMEQLLRGRGHRQGSVEEPCDCYIINTCTVTAVADKKNRNMIRRLRRQNPTAVIAVCGCYAQLKPEDIRALGADVISGSGGREEFLALVEKTVADRQARQAVDKALSRREFELLPPGGLSSRTRAMLKVQDGCNNFCTYCVIPYARGPVRSLPLAQAVEQAKELACRGYKEIVINGIEIASWGWDFKNGATLVELVDAICAAVPQVRIRLGSLEPRCVTQEFCRRLCRHDNLCPQFHLSLQSGSDGVLRRMGRKYTAGEFLSRADMLRQAFPGCAITTDMIVAFPGETEEEFAQSMAFISACGFASMHIFPYSRRPGTPADKMPGQLGNAVKQRRSAAAIAQAKIQHERFCQTMVGTVQKVLFEEPAGELLTGHAPNGMRVYAPGRGLRNEICPVRITRLYEDGLLGELVEECPGK